MQGLIIGGLIQGVTIIGDDFSGSVFDIFVPFRSLPLSRSRRLCRSRQRLATSKGNGNSHLGRTNLARRDADLRGAGHVTCTQRPLFSPA